MKILVVDDDEIIRRMFARMFQILGHPSVIVASGNEAIDKVKSESFNIIFLDMVLPDTDGVEVYKSINKINPDIPIVMMTGYAVENKVQKAMELGALDYIYKPFDVQDIVSILKKLAARKELKPPPEEEEKLK